MNVLMTRLCCAPGVRGSLRSADISADQLCCPQVRRVDWGVGTLAPLAVLAGAADVGSHLDECTQMLL